MITGCTGLLAMPVTTPSWLVVAFLLVNRPGLKLLWHFLTLLISLPLLSLYLFGVSPRPTSYEKKHRQLTFVPLTMLALSWLLLSLPLPPTLTMIGQALAVATIIVLIIWWITMS